MVSLPLRLIPWCGEYNNSRTTANIARIPRVSRVPISGALGPGGDYMNPTVRVWDAKSGKQLLKIGIPTPNR